MDLDCLAMTKLKKSRTLYTEKSVYLQIPTWISTKYLAR